MRVLLIDNFDSFVYNLAQYIGALGAEPVVLRNDRSIEELDAVHPDAVVVSPGPGRPEEAGCSVEAILHFADRVPVLGVCLGHQAIGVAFGGKVIRAERVMHGKTSMVQHQGDGVLQSMPQPFEATRYHSLVIDPTSVPDELQITASTDEGIVMAVQHRTKRVEGVQFHPESVLTTDGLKLVENFLSYAR